MLPVTAVRQIGQRHLCTSSDSSRPAHWAQTQRWPQGMSTSRFADWKQMVHSRRGAAGTGPVTAGGAWAWGAAAGAGEHAGVQLVARCEEAGGEGGAAYCWGKPAA